MTDRGRATVVTGIAALLFGASASFGAGTAIAAPLIGTCGGEVEGDPGTPVAVRLGSAELITIGEVPESGSAKLSASKLPLGGVLCTVTATAVEPVAPVVEPVQEIAAPVGEAVGVPVGPAPAAPAAPAQPAPVQQPELDAVSAPETAAVAVPAVPAAPAAVQPFGPFLPEGFTAQGAYAFGPMSSYDYSQLFTASPSAFGSLSSSPDLFGSSPSFGILGAEEAAGAAQDVAAAGRAQVLPTQGTDRVALPVLAAVLMLSAVTAALVRTWVHGATRA